MCGRASIAGEKGTQIGRKRSRPDQNTRGVTVPPPEDRTIVVDRVKCEREMVSRLTVVEDSGRRSWRSGVFLASVVVRARCGCARVCVRWLLLDRSLSFGNRCPATLRGGGCDERGGRWWRLTVTTMLVVIRQTSEEVVAHDATRRRMGASARGEEGCGRGRGAGRRGW